MGIFSWFFRHKADNARREAATCSLTKATEEVKEAVIRTNVITARNTLMFDDARKAGEETIKRLAEKNEEKDRKDRKNR